MTPRLYRAKRIDTREWVVGWYLEIDQFGYIYTGNGEERYPVYPLTLGQSTGLFDSRNNEVFEGDLVKPIPANGRKGIRTVLNIDGSFFYTYGGHKKTHAGCLTKYLAKIYTVIGNIHDPA